MGEGVVYPLSLTALSKGSDKPSVEKLIVSLLVVVLLGMRLKL
jgi:hypothetical protein